MTISTPRFLLKNARELRKSQTPAEKRLWPKLREMKQIGVRFRRQVIFDRYIVDFASHSSKIVIELDGDSHGTDEAVIKDAARDKYLTSRGYTVLRFTNQVVHENLENVVDAIVRHVSPPTPNPSPRGGGGRTAPGMGIYVDNTKRDPSPPSPSRGGIEGGGRGGANHG